MTEALVVAVLSWVLALLSALPLTALLDWLVGTLGFLAPVPFAWDGWAALLWLAIVLVVALAASLVPAGNAASLSVREALAHP